MLKLRCRLDVFAANRRRGCRDFLLETIQNNAETRCNGQRGCSGTRDKLKSREDDEARDDLHELRCGAPPKSCTAAGRQVRIPHSVIARISISHGLVGSYVYLG